MTILFRIRDRTHPEYDSKRSNENALMAPTRLMKKEGVIYSLGDGDKVELFTIGTLAKAIDRIPDTIIKWEKQKRFPRPMFQVDKQRAFRWYSGVQIMNFHNLAWGKYKVRKNHLAQTDAFLRDVLRVFYEDKVVIDEDGNFIVPSKGKKKHAAAGRD